MSIYRAMKALIRSLSLIDIWLVVRAQRLAHWTQRKFGMSATNWMQLFSSLSVIAGVIGCDHGHLCVIFAAIDFIYLNIARQRRKRNDTVIDLGNVDRLGRIARIVLMPVFLYYDTQSGCYWIEMTTVACIFLACSDLPTRKSDVRQALENLVSSPAKTASVRT